jgi:hypothetical protein
VFEAFSLAYRAEYAIHKKPCVVFLDNAPTHTSSAFSEQLDKWGSRGLLLQYLPPYIPKR